MSLQSDSEEEASQHGSEVGGSYTQSSTSFSTPPKNSYNQRVVRHLYRLYRKQAKRRHNYQKLIGFLTFIALFIAMLFLQKSSAVAYAVHSTLTGVAQPADSIFTSTTDVYDWLSGLVKGVWQDPVCGDGHCELPFEYPTYGDFGCTSDCGRMSNRYALTRLQIDMVYDFEHPVGSLPAAVSCTLKLRTIWVAV